MICGRSGCGAGGIGAPGGWFAAQEMRRGRALLTPVHARLVLYEVLRPFIVLAGEAVRGLDLDDGLPALRATGEPSTETDDVLADRDADA